MNTYLTKFNKCKILVVGDLMVDEYLWGDVDRISPEAPVQVVSVKNENYTLGGSGNVVNNLVELGAKVSVIGVTGTDRHGNLLLKKLNELGVDTAGVVQEPDRPTTRKTRIIAANQHVLRIDRETKRKISAGTFELLAGFIEEKVSSADLILISDYEKGLITSSLLLKLIESAEKHNKITIADPKGLNFSKYSGVRLLTPNRKEAALATGTEILDEAALIKAGNKIFDTAIIDNLLITCGKDGMMLFEKNKEPYKISAKARQVYDVSGAGDTVLAVIGLALASGASLKDSSAIANTAAGIVVGKVGTATVSSKELVSALTSYSDHTIFKQKTLSELESLTKELKKNGKKIVLTNGCFDLLHAGHIMLFSASKQLGDIFIVAIDDDDSVKSLKGQGRPVICESERVRILGALDSIDYIVVFSSNKLEKLIQIIQPDILTKGSNYRSEEVFGHELVEQYGGRVVLIPVIENISSTGIINNIKRDL
ncbi:MAG: D-glycero-beta-D-manno-heptose-7-phosphate kinase [Desulfobacterales bacterium]|nr:D-glycero-beta-D-manno-heptose-7-phosphate kinase [Desulfobacterales bacterium]